MKKKQAVESPRSLIEAIAHEAVQRNIWDKRNKEIERQREEGREPGKVLIPLISPEAAKFFQEEEAEIIRLVAPLAFALGGMPFETKDFLAKDFEDLLKQAQGKAGQEYIPPPPTEET